MTFLQRAWCCVAVCITAVSCTNSIVDFPKADAGPSCGTGTLACGNTCVNTSVDSKNCGACGKTCKADESCAGGTCFPNDCSDGMCSPEQVCFTGETCTFKVCVGTSCPSGQYCNNADGRCLPNTCTSKTCATGLVCVNDECKDLACENVSCNSGSTCFSGKCYPNDCANADCGSTQVCVNGMTCRDTLCVQQTCPSGQHCSQGECLPTSCTSMSCASGEVCKNNACLDPDCVGVTCKTSGQVCHGGMCGAASNCDGGAPNDVANCGACGNACPAPVHAPPACYAGNCGRGSCDTGFYDLDGPATPGCESRCVGNVCTLPDGGTITLSQPPGNETSFGVLGAAGSAGPSQGVNSTYRNVGVLSESPGTTAPPATNSTHKHTGGFIGITK